jgi:DNA-binding transcriptional ArsR family regulator
MRYSASALDVRPMTRLFKALGDETRLRIVALLARSGKPAVVMHNQRGRDFFRPACLNCLKCRSLRIDVNDFKPSQSQRRAMRNNSHIRVVVQAPTVSKDHLQLYRDYHEDMYYRREWPRRTITEADYWETFLAGDNGFAREFLYYDGDQLVGVALGDPAWTRLEPQSVSGDPNPGAEARIADPLWTWRDAPCATPDRLRVISRVPDTFVVEANLPCPGLVIAGDAYYPGWRAWIDGREAPLVMTNGRSRSRSSRWCKGVLGSMKPRVA